MGSVADVPAMQVDGSAFVTNIASRVIIVRYADDFVMGFQYEADAQQMKAAVTERLAQFRLALQRDKTSSSSANSWPNADGGATHGAWGRLRFSASRSTARGVETGALWSSGGPRESA